jgi:hypothetical protein
VGADRLIEVVETRIIHADVIEFLANHYVSEKASAGRGEIGSEERHLDGAAEAFVVGLLRAEISGSGTGMNVPAVPVEMGDVGANLGAREVLVLRIGTPR